MDQEVCAASVDIMSLVLFSKETGDAGDKLGELFEFSSIEGQNEI